MPPRKNGRRAAGWEWRTILVVLSAFFMETVLILVVHDFWAVTHESVRQPPEPGGFVVMLPFALVCGGPLFFAATVALVLPGLGWARRLGRARAGLRPWAVLLVAAGLALGPAVLLGPLAGLGGSVGPWLLLWLVLWAGIALAIQLAELSARRVADGGSPALTGPVFGYGGLAAVVVLGLGLVALDTGLLDEYRPPTLSVRELSGTWTDGRGGVLRLAPDGTATTRGARAAVPGGDGRDSRDSPDTESFGRKRCSGSGSWTYAPGDSAWGQRLRVEADGCEWTSDWTLSGTVARPKLNYQYSDPDSPDWYVFTRR